MLAVYAGFSFALLCAGSVLAGDRVADVRAVPLADSAIDEPVLASFREVSFTAYLTGYSYWDNTPPGSAAIARPVLHGSAAGTGTYHDPITIAVGYRLVGGRAQLDYPAGTRFYIPSLRRYAIVEDICGDGPQPHLTGCHRGKNGLPWLDIYVDGQRAGAGAANACMYSITGTRKIIMNPRPNYRVTVGALTESGCGGANS
ncbi:hypothetical protein [Pseudorhodobacter ferrugineus]|uniref:hypothetical protein n=1 Tax=Pseudorhodobacter ferrugineus TaxID=77008 RepID=UPI0003B61647|nr:hypothetical protein [Pseudorhodobacter ferrugineus]